MALPRVGRRSLLLIVAALGICALGSAQVRYDTFIHLTTGDSLDATYFIPSQSIPLKGFPGIIFIHGFGATKFATLASCSLYASEGYMTLCFSVRGHGLSSGNSTIMADRERDDFAEVLGWFRSLADLDTSAIGISGGSQGGLHGLWAAADRLPVAAVTSDVIVPQWASDMLANGTIRRTAILLLQTNSVRYDTSRTALWNFVRTDSYDSLRALFVPGRDVDTTQLNSAFTPTLRLLKWQDHYFAAQDGLEAFHRYAGAKKIYVGTGGHFSDVAGPENEYQYDQVTRWLDHYLRYVNNGIDTDPAYSYAYSSLPMDTTGFFQWTRVESPVWPPAGIQNIRFYLSADSALSITPQTSPGDSFLLKNDYLNPSYTFDIAYIEGFQGPSFDAALPKSTLVFKSVPLDNDVTWLGVPRMHLFGRSADSKFPVNAQVYEEDPAGNKYFVNRINYTARSWLSGAEDTIDAFGIPHAHRFQHGNRIRLELTNIDVTNRKLIGSYPFVVPMIAQAGVTILADAGHQSYIELPMIGTPTGVENGPRALPVSTALYQNFPNPFNPETKVSFVIGSASGGSHVKLTIFDLLGRNVATLVDERKDPGQYTVSVDGSNLAGGVYFYRLEADRAVQVKKMLLVR